MQVWCTRGWGRSCENVTIFRNYRSSADTESREGSTLAHAAPRAGQHPLRMASTAGHAKRVLASAGCFARKSRPIPRFHAELRRLAARVQMGAAERALRLPAIRSRPPGHGGTADWSGLRQIDFCCSQSGCPDTARTCCPASMIDPKSCSALSRLLVEQLLASWSSRRHQEDS